MKKITILPLLLLVFSCGTKNLSTDSSHEGSNDQSTPPTYEASISSTPKNNTLNPSSPSVNNPNQMNNNNDTNNSTNNNPNTNNDNNNDTSTPTNSSLEQEYKFQAQIDMNFASDDFTKSNSSLVPTLVTSANNEIIISGVTTSGPNQAALFAKLNPTSGLVDKTYNGGSGINGVSLQGELVTAQKLAYSATDKKFYFPILRSKNTETTYSIVPFDSITGQMGGYLNNALRTNVNIDSLRVVEVGTNVFASYMNGNNSYITKHQKGGWAGSEINYQITGAPYSVQDMIKTKDGVLCVGTVQGKQTSLQSFNTTNSTFKEVNFKKQNVFGTKLIAYDSNYYAIGYTKNLMSIEMPSITNFTNALSELFSIDFQSPPMVDNVPRLVDLIKIKTKYIGIFSTTGSTTLPKDNRIIIADVDVTTGATTVIRIFEAFYHIDSTSIGESIYILYYNTNSNDRHLLKLN